MKKLIKSPLNPDKGYVVTVNHNIDSWIVTVDECKIKLTEEGITTRPINQVVEIETTNIIDTIEKLNKTIHDYDCSKNVELYLELSGFED